MFFVNEAVYVRQKMDDALKSAVPHTFRGKYAGTAKKFVICNDFK